MSHLKRFLIVTGIWLGGFAALAIACIVWSYFNDRAPANAPMIEKVSANEEFYASRIVASTIEVEVSNRDRLLKGKEPVATTKESAPGYNPADYRRDVHTKSHGCVAAHMTVDDDIDRSFRYGVFSEPKKRYEGIVRFSSGKPDLEPDSVRNFMHWDVRGMALKLFDVDGKELLDFEEGRRTQDFIATTSPVFFIRTLAQYDEFSAAFSEGLFAKYFMPHWYDPRGWHTRQFVLMAEGFEPRPASLVTKAYYSGSAYRLGPREHVKFKFRPCANNKPIPPDSKSPGATFDYLRLELAGQAASGSACFDFMVQPQVIGKNMPIEDTTVEWREKDSPFVKIATLQFDAAPNTTRERAAEMNRRCENLEFNPWHAREEHKPVGAMNRIRKIVYQQMSAYRRTKNCESLCRQSCRTNAGGGPCGDGCYGACMKGCPLLQEPVPANLQVPNSCGVQESGPLTASK